MVGPGAIISSGFGGLGLDGMTGNDDSVGDEAAGVGNSGLISGERSGLVAGGEDRGDSNGRRAGAAEITEMGISDRALKENARGSIANASRSTHLLAAILMVVLCYQELLGEK